MPGRLGGPVELGLADLVLVALGLLAGGPANTLISRWPGGNAPPRSRTARAWLVRLALPALWVLTWRAAGPGLIPGLVHLLYAFAMLVVFFTDWEQAIIPNRIVLPGAAVALVMAAGRADPAGPSLVAGLLAALAGGGLFLALNLASGGAGMGMGDVKLMLFLGLALGPQKLLLAVLAGSLAALALTAVALLFFGPRVRRLDSATVDLAGGAEEGPVEDRFLGLMMINGKPAVPYGTFLVLGYFGAYFWGDRILHLWLGT